MSTKEMINSYQLTIMVALITVGDAILVLPASVAIVAKQDAWISMLLSLLFGSLVVLLFVKVSKLQSNLSFVQVILKILGKPIGSIVVMFFLLYLLFSVSILLRELGDFITTQILLETPIKVINLLFITVIIFGVRSGLATLARVSEVFYPVVFLFLVTLFTLVLPSIQIEWIRPLLGHGFKPVINGTIIATSFPFMELIVILMFIPNILKKNKFRKNFLTGALFGGTALFINVLLCTIVLGVPTTIRNVYPTFILARSISVGHYIQRIEGLIAIFWMITVFIKITLYSYAFHIGVKQLFNLKNYRQLTYPFGFILFGTSILVASNYTEYSEIISKYWSYYDMTVAIFIPFLLIIVSMFRKKTNPQKNKQQKKA
ncbi:GerAB/ArcD/ProY family transporter [Amphibacillus xylanus]|uniref:Putative spore germination protein n=1 Tax=Amphibacillus xylanus (strain ATCC 51415 / DSM 6626 / JCM 7361 / LMG 17667 / NBRC 15112 / Ep01) TaxID=698758 RepID=K0IZC3_AMPXN|nr:endospore germination permease [Amphibacillus xylanus]BAM47900.1 putative spore germination protein [Amphibacillus xylanus NBRC 15112]